VFWKSILFDAIYSTHEDSKWRTLESIMICPIVESNNLSFICFFLSSLDRKVVKLRHYVEMGQHYTSWLRLCRNGTTLYLLVAFKSL
jgi:hypothetical protein